MFFQLFGTAPHGGNVGIATSRAGAWHALGHAAMVTSQGAVNFVKHAVGTAMCTFAFPIAISAVQHRCITAPVQQQHALLTLGHALLNGRDQRRRQHGFARLVVHVHAPDKWQ